MGDDKKPKDNPCPGPGAETSCPCGDKHKEPEKLELTMTKGNDDVVRWPDGTPVKRIWP